MVPPLVLSVTLKRGHHKEVRGIWRSSVFPLLFFSGLILTSRNSLLWVSGPSPTYFLPSHTDEHFRRLTLTSRLLPCMSLTYPPLPEPSLGEMPSRSRGCIIFLEISGTMYSQLGTYFQLSRHFKYSPALPLPPPPPIAIACLNPKLLPSRPATQAASSLGALKLRSRFSHCSPYFSKCCTK